ncbi:MAG: hypothetical protein Q9172_004436 [Xanthocarpia lactea]
MLPFMLPLFVFPLTACAAETVLGVYIFSRHRDRTAKSTPPAYLTKIGYSQIFTSGTSFRNRYVASNATSRKAGINSDTVKQSQITASAPLDTILMNSAQGFLQGLYPPVGSSLGSDTLRNGRLVSSPLDGYYLIPIQPTTSGAGSEDNPWLGASTSCAEALVSSNKYFNSSPKVFDLLNVASIHNASLSNSALLTNNTRFQLRTLADRHEIGLAFNSTDPIRAIAGSTLAAQIVQGLDNTIKSQGKSKITNELGAYASFLSFFGLANLIILPNSDDSFSGIPDYASTMTFELFTTADISSFPTVEDPQVRFSFHNGTTDENSTPKVYPLFGQPSTE